MSYKDRDGQRENDNDGTKVSITKRYSYFFVFPVFSLYVFLCYPSFSVHVYCYILCSCVTFIFFHYFILLFLLTFISPELINYFVISAKVSAYTIFTLKITSGSTTNLLHACPIKLCWFMSNIIIIFHLLSEILNNEYWKQ